MSNSNRIETSTFSNPDSQRLYQLGWPDEPETAQVYADGRQCGGCSCFAKFNYDWGLCCCPVSRHHLETFFEHFTCPSIVDEGWESHSFFQTPEQMKSIRKLLDRER